MAIYAFDQNEFEDIFMSVFRFISKIVLVTIGVLLIVNIMKTLLSYAIQNVFQVMNHVFES